MGDSFDKMTYRFYFRNDAPMSKNEFEESINHYKPKGMSLKTILDDTVYTGFTYEDTRGNTYRFRKLVYHKNYVLKLIDRCSDYYYHEVRNKRLFTKALKTTEQHLEKIFIGKDLAYRDIRLLENIFIRFVSKEVGN